MCPYCHNWKTLIQSKIPQIPFDEILAFLKKRVGILDGVVISGGEPTMMKELPEKIRKIKELGFLVKLDTNGTNPTMLKQLIDEKLIDYVSMDIKHSFTKMYDIIVNRKINLDLLRQSIAILLEDKVDYEFRTTLMEEYHDIDSIYEIGKAIEGAKRLFLQKFVVSDGVVDKTLHPIEEETARKYMDILSQYVHDVNLRGY